MPSTSKWQKHVPEQPALSVVTVCRNAATDLPSTIESVAKQLDASLEYIVIDGASTDETKSVLERYSSCINVILSEPDNGIYDAMNKGLAMARGSLVHFLNAKDTFADAHVASKVIATYQRTAAEILYGDVLVGQPGCVKRQSSYANWDLAAFFEQPMCHQGVFASKFAVQHCGLFDTSYSIAADLDWLLKALKQHRMRSHYLSFPIAYFDDGGVSSDSSSADFSKVRSETRRAVRSHFSQFEVFGYRLARRCRVRRGTAPWRLMCRIMGWQLS